MNEGDVAVLRSTNFRRDGGLSLDNAAQRSVKHSALTTRQLRAGDILLEKSGGGPNQPVGRVAYVGRDLKRTICGNFIQLLRPKKEVNPRWLFSLLWQAHSSGITLAYQSQTTGIRNLRTQDYLRRSVAVPPTEEQHRIADVALALDNYVARCRSELRALSDLRAAVSSSLWSYPERAPLNAIGKTITGTTPKTSVVEYWSPTDVMFITPGDFDGRLILARSERQVSRRGAAASRELTVASIAQVCIGATIGKVAVVAHESVANQQINAVTGLDLSDALFGSAALSASQGQLMLLDRAAKTTLPIIKKSAWESLEIPWPSREEREARARHLLAIHEGELALNSRLDAIMQLSEAVLSALLSGAHAIPASYDRLLPGNGEPSLDPVMV